jgi:hypothetical protein
LKTREEYGFLSNPAVEGTVKRMSKRLTVSLLLNVCPRIPPLDPITKASDLDPVFECEMLKKVVRLDKIIS